MKKNSCISDIEFFPENITTLNKTSKDGDNVEYMTESEVTVINFDAVKEAYFKSFGSHINVCPCSVDALVLQNNGRWAFIEFKNGVIDSKERRNIRLKIKSSLLILCDIVKVNLDFTREKLDLYLIYNHDKNNSSREKINDSVAVHAGEEPPRFKYLKMYENVFFKNVQSYSNLKIEDFVRNIVPININTIFL